METKEEKLRRLEEMGRIDPNCPGCKIYYEEGPDAMNPPHNALKSCQSGGRNHCTCDSCF